MTLDSPCPRSRRARARRPPGQRLSAARLDTSASTRPQRAACTAEDVRTACASKASDGLRRQAETTGDAGARDAKQIGGKRVGSRQHVIAQDLARCRSRLMGLLDSVCGVCAVPYHGAAATRRLSVLPEDETTFPRASPSYAHRPHSSCRAEPSVAVAHGGSSARWQQRTPCARSSFSAVVRKTLPCDVPPFPARTSAAHNRLRAGQPDSMGTSCAAGTDPLSRG